MSLLRKGKKGKSKKKKKEPKVYEMPPLFKKIEREVIEPKVPLDVQKFYKDMKEKIELYDNDIKGKYFNYTSLENEEFRIPFFEQLKKMFHQITNIEEPYTKSVQVKELWEWYNKKIIDYHDMFRITKRTKKNHLEQIEEADLSLKSDYFNAGNFPKCFERNNRTEDTAILPSKDRIKEFKSKHVTGYVNEKMNVDIDRRKAMFFDSRLNELEKEKLFYRKVPDRISQLKGKNNITRKVFEIQKEEKDNKLVDIMKQRKNDVILKQKYLKSKDSDASKLIVEFNQVGIEQMDFKYEISTRREIKSANTHYRYPFEPEYLGLANKIMKEKNRELKEKRNIEENKEYIKNWGRAKSNYKRSREEKHEMLNNIIEIEKQISKEISTEKMRVKSAFDEYKISDNNLLKKYQDPNLITNISNENVVLNKKISNNSVLTKESEKNTRPLTSLKASRSRLINFDMKNQIKEENDNNNNDSNMEEYNNNNEDVLADVQEIEDFDDYKKPNLKDNKVNINYNDIHSSTQISFNLSKDKISSKMLNNKKDLELKPLNIIVRKNKLDPIKLSERETLPSDFVSEYSKQNKIFETRHKYSKLIDVKIIDNSKMHYANTFTPLSAFDKKHIERKKEEASKINNELKLLTKQRPSTGVELLRAKKYDSYNLLENRRLVSGINRNLVDEVKTHQFSKGKNISSHKLNTNILIPDYDSYYFKHQLPKNNLNYIDYPKDPKKKKKRRATKKKKKW